MKQRKKLLMSNYVLVQDPHLLFTGSNGRETYGITVRNNRLSKEESQELGYQYEFNINDVSFFRMTKEFVMDILGISSEKYDELSTDLNK